MKIIIDGVEVDEAFAGALLIARDHVRGLTGKARDRASNYIAYAQRAYEERDRYIATYWLFSAIAQEQY